MPLDINDWQAVIVDTLKRKHLFAHQMLNNLIQIDNELIARSNDWFQQFWTQNDPMYQNKTTVKTKKHLINMNKETIQQWGAIVPTGHQKDWLTYQPYVYYKNNHISLLDLSDSLINILSEQSINTLEIIKNDFTLKKVLNPQTTQSPIIGAYFALILDMEKYLISISDTKALN